MRIPSDPIEKAKLIEKIEKGLLHEGELKAEDVSSLAVPDTHCILYILNLSMNKGEEGTNYGLLIDNLLNTIKEYAKKRIFFDCVYTRLFINDHFSIYSDLGFERVSDLEW